MAAIICFETMKVFLILGAVLAAVGSELQVPSAFDYHAKVGIAEAKRIKEQEDTLLSSSGEIKQRIVGGVVSSINGHPHLAGLVINLVNTAGMSACGSSLLSPRRLVTAAHCWFDGVNQAWQFTVVLGSSWLFSGGLRIPTTQVFMHPQWVPSLILNDVAMIHLPQNVIYTATIQPVSLPTGNMQWESFVNEWAIAAGFGKTNDQQVGVSPNAVVSQVQLQVISVAQCQATFQHFAQPSNICTNGAGGVGICGGDSGGPLTIFRNGQTILVGISSYVAQTGCQLGHPSAFARVTSFLSFITQHLF